MELVTSHIARVLKSEARIARQAGKYSHSLFKGVLKLIEQYVNFPL